MLRTVPALTSAFVLWCSPALGSPLPPPEKSPKVVVDWQTAYGETASGAAFWKLCLVAFVPQAHQFVGRTVASSSWSEERVVGAPARS